MTTPTKKLIEVALPLDAINTASQAHCLSGRPSEPAPRSRDETLYK